MSHVPHAGSSPAALPGRRSTPASGRASRPGTDGPVAAPRDPAPEIDRLAALADALAAVGDRWSLLLVASLLDGPLRFGELQERLGAIAPNVLTQRLRQLSHHGLVLAQPYSERPPRYLYELTGAGRELADTLRMLTHWGARHAPGSESEPPRHAVCGTPLEARWYCPACQEPVDEPGEDELLYA